VATHPDVVAALFRAASGGCTGHGGTGREVSALVEATQEHARAAASAAAVAAAAAAAASPRSPGGAEDITDAAARAAADARAAASPARAPPRPAPRLPAPALPPALVAYAAAFAARVDDLVPGGPPPADAAAAAAAAALPAALAKRAAAPPRLSFALTAATKLAFAPAAHAHAFELADAKGFLAGGTTRLLLRAVHEGDATEWALAINTLLETGLASAL